VTAPSSSSLPTRLGSSRLATGNRNDHLGVPTAIAVGVLFVAYLNLENNVIQTAIIGNAAGTVAKRLESFFVPGNSTTSMDSCCSGTDAHLAEAFRYR
jgi:hypothetical protein